MIALKLASPKRTTGLVGDVFIHVTEEGFIDIVSEYEILRHTDIQVLSM